MIVNPILPGFNPDPSILRVGDDYFIATSTFEWFPGVQIHHSRDLVHWRLLTHPLNRTSQLDLRGDPSSGGVWAPNLTYSNGVFYLLFTDVKTWKHTYKDTPNYLVTATDILGPWSEPIHLNSSGFDPFLFHDVDGRKWLLNMRWDFRKNRAHFSGIVLQEYSPESRKLVGPIKHIFSGTQLGVTEGPGLYHRGDMYYLVVAEGGTGYNHAVTVARSQRLEGPYEADPELPLLTTVHAPGHPLQKAGHGSLVETQTGEWYLAHLCARPLPSRLCPLGRETALQRVRWTGDGWPRLDHGGILPAVTVPAPALAAHPFEPEPTRYDFDAPQLPICFQTLRVPAVESWVSLTARPGYLRIRGQESLNSWSRQSMVARRVQHYHCEAETCVEFHPQNYMQMAGLACFYDERDHYYLRISHDEQLGIHLGIISSDQGKYDELPETVSVEGWDRCYLKVTVAFETLQFARSRDGVHWEPIGSALAFGRLSDEYAGKLGFTGAFVGMCVQDLGGTGMTADFDFFRYAPLVGRESSHESITSGQFHCP